jgi:hypothetical protein
MGKIYVDDIGVEIRLDVGQSLTGATEIKIKVEKPDGTTASWTATAYSDQVITYTTTSAGTPAVTDLNVAGKYKLQAYVKWGDTSVHRGETYTMRVYDHYE